MKLDFLFPWFAKAGRFLVIGSFFYSFSSWAQSGLKLVTSITDDRQGVLVKVISDQSEDMLCEGTQVQIELCDADFCRNTGEMTITIPAFYLSSQQVKEFSYTKILDAFQNGAPSATAGSSEALGINKVSGSFKNGCRPAKFKDYCQWAPKTDDELHTLGVINERLSVDVCEIEPSSIKELDLGGEGIRSVKPLSFFHSLERLWLPRNQIEDLTPLRSLSSLEKIQLDENKTLMNIDALMALRNLQYVYARETSIKTMPTGARPPNLKKIYLEGKARTCEVTVYENDGTITKHLCEN